jgi:hypothetical protein
MAWFTRNEHDPFEMQRPRGFSKTTKGTKEHEGKLGYEVSSGAEAVFKNNGSGGQL